MTEGAEAAVDLVDVDALEAVEVLKVPEFLENSIFRKLHLQEYFPRENLSVLWSSSSYIWRVVVVKMEELEVVQR